MKTKKTKSRRILIICSAVVGTLALSAAAFFIYTSIYYKAEEDATALIEQEQVAVKEEKNWYALSTEEGEQTKVGLVFYPGAKVDSYAYAPMLATMAKQATIFDCKMPFHLAFFDMNMGNDVISAHPEIYTWYIMGHSLGGATMGAYLRKNADKYAGAIFLASYSTKDLTSSMLKVLVIHGSNDKVLNYKNFDKNAGNLPSDTIFVTIEGGNHGQFGDYGFQKGDGEATISKQEQWAITAKDVAILIGTK